MFAALWDFATLESTLFALLWWGFLGATVLQLVLWGFVFTNFWKTAPRAGVQHPDIGQEPLLYPSVSIVICARNEAMNLSSNLVGVLEQRYSGVFEVIVVDDASNDGSLSILEAYQQSYPNLRLLRVVEKKMPGKKQALELGIAAARYEWLLCTDADCRPASPHWLASMMHQDGIYPETAIILGYAPMLPKPGFLQAWARFEVAFTALQYVAFARMGSPYMGVGRNLAWKKTLFATAGKFAAHADLASGDDDLFINAVAGRSNTSVCLAPAAFVYSAAKPTWVEWWRQKQRHLSTGVRYRAKHRRLLGAIALTHTLHYGLGTLLLLCQQPFLGVLLLYGLRFFFVSLVYTKAFRMLRAQPLLPLLPLWDGLLAVYYGLFVPLVLWRRRTSRHWR